MKSIDQIISEKEKEISIAAEQLNAFNYLKDKYINNGVMLYKYDADGLDFKFDKKFTQKLSQNISKIHFSLKRRLSIDSLYAEFSIVENFNKINMFIYLDDSVKLFSYKYKYNYTTRTSSYDISEIFDYEKFMKKSSFPQDFINDCHLKVIEYINSNQYKFDFSKIKAPDYIKSLIMLT